jgi:hypothetical protein|tara:strand:- start:5211 stop:5621 length:411 start_codon:yes stop_codon:yes gene_type:complete
MLTDYYSKIESTYCRKINIKYDYDKCCGPCNKKINNTNIVLNTWGDTVLNIYGYMCNTCQNNRFNKMNDLINSNSKKEIDNINKDLLIEDNIIWKNILENYDNNDIEFDFILYNIEEELLIYSDIINYNTEIKFLK